MKDPHTDKPLVNVVRLGEPCEACKKGEMPWMCSHRDEDPPWKSRAKSRKFEPIYLLEGLEHVHLREQFGMDADDQSKAFDPSSVKALDEAELYRLQKRPPVIFLTADPSGHGNSGYALCGSFFDHGRYVIFFLEDAPMRSGYIGEARNRVIGAVKSIRNISPYLRDVPVVYIPEVEPGHSVSYGGFYLAGVEDVLTMRESAGDKYGVPKTDISTYEMFYQYQSMLLNDQVSFCDHLYSLTRTPEDAKRNAIEQHYAYAWLIEEAVGGRDPKVKLTGKMGGKNDDALITIMMTPYWSVRFLRRVGFAPYDQMKDRCRQLAMAG